MISIIIPTFNEEKCLPRLLRSITEQSFLDYEIIIADNNSTDNTLAIAKQYGAMITSGGLPGKGRNMGAKIAKRSILLFLDADVVLENKEFLSDAFIEMKSKKIDVATCMISPISNLKRDFVMHEIYNFIMLIAEKISPFAPGFCIFAKKSIHDQINGFDEEILLGEDSDYVKRAKKISNFKILKSQKIDVSVRRLDRDGRLNIAIKYFLCGLYMIVFGNIKTDIFNYTWGHKD